MIEIIDWACTIFTVAGSCILSRKKDHIIGWKVYTVAAILGVLIFIVDFNLQRLIVWIVFLVNDIVAIRRKVVSARKNPSVCDFCGKRVIYGAIIFATRMVRKGYSTFISRTEVWCHDCWIKEHGNDEENRARWKKYG